MRLCAATIAAFTIAATMMCVPLRADDATKKPLTPEMAITLRSESDLRFSPDGRRVAFVVSEPLHGAKRQTHIWVLDVATHDVRQFTSSAKSEHSPRWSPRRHDLAFLSDRSGDEAQIYLLPGEGGEAYPLTQGKRSIESFAWSPDGKQIAFVAPDAKTDAEEQKEKDKDDAHVVDKDDKPAGLWVLDVVTHKERRIISVPWKVSEAEWLPGGDRLIISATDHPESDENTDRIFTVTAADGKMTELFAPRGSFGELKISPDGKWVGYLAARVDGPDPHDLYVISTSGGMPSNLTGTSIDRQIGDYAWRPDGTLEAVVTTGFHTQLYDVTVEGKATPLRSQPVNPLNFDLSRTGNVAYSGGTATQPAEIWFANADTPAQRVSDFNKGWNAVELMQPEILRYASFDGTEIEGALLLPPGYDGHAKLPLITLIHGGPTGNWSDSVQVWGQMLAARGYAIFYPNVRGSTGYGEKFLEMNRADWGGGDFKDMMAGIDSLIARGVADPNRLGIGGWSYGGYMAEWAITQTTRFKAAVSGAGMSDLIAEFGTENGPSYDEWFWGQPYEQPRGFLKASPILYMRDVKTPTLILQGENDTTDPLGQSQQLYRALKHYGVKAELVEYPREPHGPREEKHNLDILNRILLWYDENLK